MINYIYKKYRHFIKGIKNLISWFPIIWNDRDYDQYYLYIMMEKKLRNMSNEFLTCDYVNLESEGVLLSNCADALHRLVKDEYENSGFEEIDNQYGELHIVDEETCPDGTIKVKLVRDGVKTEDEEKIVNSRIMTIIQSANDERMNDISFVCDNIKNNSFKWWW